MSVHRRGLAGHAADPAFSVSEGTVLDTGAARGMGRLHAHRAASEGAATVVLWGRAAEGLRAATAELTAAHPETAFRADVVDVSDLEGVSTAARAILAEVGAPDVLVNNAGVVTGRPFWEHDPASDIHHSVAVNAEGPMQVTRAFLPAMIERGSPARIVNVASAAGLTASPRMSVYAGAKAAVIIWSDTLRVELVQAGHEHVRVVTVCPAFVSTGMFAGARPPRRTPVLRPEDVVAAVWDALPTAPALMMLPPAVRFSTFLKGVLPQRAFDAVVGRTVGVYTSMESFIGHRDPEADFPAR